MSYDLPTITRRQTLPEIHSRIDGQLNTALECWRAWMDADPSDLRTLQDVERETAVWPAGDEWSTLSRPLVSPNGGRPRKR